MAIFAPTSAFRSVDLPALGRPISETKPERNPGAGRASLMRHGLRSADPHFLHAPLVARQHLDREAVARDRLPRARHVPQPFSDQAAYRGRFNLFLRPEFTQVAEPRQVEVP